MLKPRSNSILAGKGWVILALLAAVLGVRNALAGEEEAKRERTG